MSLRETDSLPSSTQLQLLFSYQINILWISAKGRPSCWGRAQNENSHLNGSSPYLFCHKHKHFISRTMMWNSILPPKGLLRSKFTTDVSHLQFQTHICRVFHSINSSGKKEPVHYWIFKISLCNAIWY